MKKTFAVLLAAILTMSLSTTALAAETQDVTGKGEDNKVTVDTELPLHGEVTNSAVVISVVMPTSIDFTIGTKLAAAADISEEPVTKEESAPTFDTLISGTGNVTNKSNVAIDIDVTGVTDKDKLLSLVDLALGSGNIAESAALANSLDKVSAENSIKLVSGLATSGSTTLKVFGKGKTANASGTDYPVKMDPKTYTITTTLKVSVAK